MIVDLTAALFFGQRKCDHFSSGARGVEASSRGGMFSAQVAQADGAAQERRKGRTGHVPSFFSCRIAGNEQPGSRRGHPGVKELQSGEPPVRMTARANSLNNFLSGITPFFVTDVGDFEASLVGNIFIVVILPEPGDSRFQTNR